MFALSYGEMKGVPSHGERPSPDQLKKQIRPGPLFAHFDAPRRSAVSLTRKTSPNMNPSKSSGSHQCCVKRAYIKQKRNELAIVDGAT